MFEPTVCPGGQHTAATRGMQVADCILHINIHVNLIISSFFLEFWWERGRDWNILFLNAGMICMVCTTLRVVHYCIYVCMFHLYVTHL